MDLSPILDGVLSIAGTAFVGLMPVIVPRVLNLLKVKTDAAHEASLENTLTTAVGAAISYGESAGDPMLKDVTIKNSAINHAMEFAMDDAPIALKALGYDPASISTVIDGRITQALAVKAPVAAPSALAPTPVPTIQMQAAPSSLVAEMRAISSTAATVAKP
jgi:hypothetical protein